jgi:DNA-binding NarL/FixJ family response regulator
VAPVRVFHCDDSSSFRLLVREVLRDREDVTVVGEAPSVDDALAALPASGADVVLLDLIGGTQEDALVAMLREVAPEARFVVYSGVPERSGTSADAHVPKAAPFDELHRVIVEVAGRR